ncbi:hypothetical protein BDP27DRAFT_1333680 [Rhodocollybia butyracea]|uniref:Uncharacterized protein n=1 Tax=Rhodocollybia butyracea TaxID=206335 RepID=A0A9P5U421_9AGAR|nr:hypothetical protein BDP27DRAFT_1333680 [Rhodocollybia butyracea]
MNLRTKTNRKTPTKATRLKQSSKLNIQQQKKGKVERVARLVELAMKGKRTSRHWRNQSSSSPFLKHLTTSLYLRFPVCQG